jgi:iron complex transport system ATP-binding protein
VSAAVELEGVSADYGAIPALRDLTLAVAEGGRTALLGPNGAGKSTVLRVLTGLQPARGRVRLFGRDPRAIPAAERATLVAVVPQEVVVPMAFTVGQIVLMGRTATLGRWAGPTAADRRAAEEAMAYADVLELRDRLYDELSGGERQRAVLAMALAREPRLLLLDEPTAHLDLSHRLEILQRIERLNAERGVTVLMASHDLALAAGFFGQLALLDHGRVAACGPPGEVLREEILREVYHCELRVALDADGGWTVRPARRPGAARRSGPRVHVVAGGGSGAEALRRLALEGLPVTVGVLNEGDSDAAAAAALGMEAALERPFSPLGAAALGRGRALAAAADAVVVCEVPFGPGNVANLDLAAGALARGAAVFVHDRDPDARD